MFVCCNPLKRARKVNHSGGACHQQGASAVSGHVYYMNTRACFHFSWMKTCLPACNSTENKGGQKQHLSCTFICILLARVEHSRGITGLIQLSSQHATDAPARLLHRKCSSYKTFPTLFGWIASKMSKFKTWLIINRVIL